MQKKHTTAFSSIKSLTVAAMLTAMSVIIGMFCKNFMDFGTGLFRITFENLPIIISGIFFGPFVGGAVGGTSDLVSYLLSKQSYPPNLVVTFGAVMVGVVSGAVSRFVVKKSGYAQIIISGAAAHIIGSMIIKPIGLYQFYGAAVLLRVPMYLVIAPLEITVICLLYRNRGFRMMFEDVRRDERKNSHRRNEMTYSEALDYIHSVSWKGSRPGLERITELCGAMGDPQNGMRFIHVTGTNGKGSTCAMTESILRAAGYKTGLFTSPYVKDFCERIMINGQPVSHEKLAYATEFVKGFADKMKDTPTEFELITAIGFKIFHECGCDIIVLEAGMGGLLDSTNVIEPPVLAVITGASLDHTAILGDTIAKIAKEKSGIIKSGCDALYCGNDIITDSDICAELDLNSANTRAYDVIKAETKRLGATLTCCDYSKLQIKKADLNGMMLSYKSYNNIEIPLLGLYQGRNAARVLEIVNLLNKKGFSISEQAVRDGLKQTVWHARFEKFSDAPVILYDGGHNPEGISAALEALSYYFPNQKLNLLTGVMADKDYQMMATSLSPIIKKAFCVTPDNPRSLSSDRLAEVYRGLGIDSEAFETVETGVEAAVNDSRVNGTPLICLGSLYMYAEVSSSLDRLCTSVEK